MSLNRYGLLYQQYLKKNKPEKYKQMRDNKSLMRRTLEKEYDTLITQHVLYLDIVRERIIKKECYKTVEDFDLAVKEHVDFLINKNLELIFEDSIWKTEGKYWLQ